MPVDAEDAVGLRHLGPAGREAALHPGAPDHRLPDQIGFSTTWTSKPSLSRGSHDISPGGNPTSSTATVTLGMIPHLSGWSIP